MLNKIFRVIFAMLGLLTGYEVSDTLLKLPAVSAMFSNNPKSARVIIAMIIGILLFGMIFYLLSPIVAGLILKLTGLIEVGIQKLPGGELLIGAAGLIIGLLIAALVMTPLSNIFTGSDILKIIGVVLTVIVYCIMGILGVNIATKKKEEIYNSFSTVKKLNKDKKSKGENKANIAQPKFLDTSVIIDGRILDILKTGFVEGTIVIPSFVLQELRHIADSADVLKRTRGRRGLDILNQIQKDLKIPVEITEKDFDNIAEVDAKLLKLAQVMGGQVITNDFNLNKVAEFQGVKVLNINELANAVKPVVIPGEEMNISIIKDGKESGQGIAYLDDGTMIVVEGGRKFLGETIDVVVTSVLQTAAGRMIFAKLKTAQDRAV
jgi:uncharacterized protein YacL